jgi:hypothetical protein
MLFINIEQEMHGMKIKIIKQIKIKECSFARGLLYTSNSNNR